VSSNGLTSDAVVIDLREPVVRRRYVRGQARPGALDDLGRFRNAHTYPAGPLLGDEGPDEPEVAAPTVTAVPTATVEVTEPSRVLVRRIRLRSVAKVSTGFYLCGLAIFLIAGVLLWNVADQAGWIRNWTGFLVDIGFTGADVHGDVILRASVLAGLVIVATLVLLTVVAASVYNHLSAMIGGVEMTVGPPRSRRRS
jgi:hypothetical protein